jgi:hypothetical protein
LGERLTIKKKKVGGSSIFENMKGGDSFCWYGQSGLPKEVRQA